MPKQEPQPKRPLMSFLEFVADRKTKAQSPAYSVTKSAKTKARHNWIEGARCIKENNNSDATDHFLTFQTQPCSATDGALLQLQFISFGQYALANNFEFTQPETVFLFESQSPSDSGTQ
jgi:hypothetical protein